jgi:hypothetical protein
MNKYEVELDYDYGWEGRSKTLDEYESGGEYELLGELLGEREVEWGASYDGRFLSLKEQRVNENMNKSSAAYVISNELGDCVKVGHGNPYDRLVSLQQSTPHPLELVYVFWFESKRAAYMVEQRAHRALQRDGIERLKGEWFSCSADRARDAIIGVLKKAWNDCANDGSQLELVSATPLDEIILA